MSFAVPKSQDSKIPSHSFEFLFLGTHTQTHRHTDRQTDNQKSQALRHHSF